MKITQKIKPLFSILLLRKDWWKLFNKARDKGVNSLWDYACRFRLQLQGSYIGHTAQFAAKPCFPHGPCGIFISGGAKLGKDCVIFQQVTIGSNTLAGSCEAGAPQIGDYCYIGAGAKIIGNVKVGDHCRIGANTVVTKDVPSNSTVVGGGMRIVAHDTLLDTRYFSQNGQNQMVYYQEGNWIEDPNWRIET